MAIISPDLEATTTVLGIKTAITVLRKEREARTKLVRSMRNVGDSQRQEAIAATFAAIEDMLTDTLPGRPS
jgi:hypothetical protein